jgi:DNA-binding SARP family transcriptional activator/pimeloyl-ACP methyl ester carboxylesterase/class 3 adenylate cyclase
VSSVTRANNSLEFRLLGPLEVLVGGRAVPVVGGKQRALLALLLVRANEVVPHDRLVDELWPESPPTADHALQMHVSRLRRTLSSAGAGEPIATRPGGYRLSHDPERLDLHRFESQLREAQVLLEAGEAARAVGHLRSALTLWRGEPLVGVPLGPSLSAEAARLEELRLAAVGDRVEAELVLGRHAGLVGELEALVREYPLRERLRRLLMLALYRSGRQADALAAYQDMRRTLVEELGIEPSEPLRDLERRILLHDGDLEPRRRKPADADVPEIRYARSGDTSIAYATVGEGPFDVVFISGWVLSNFGIAWEGPAAEFYLRMASFCRLILFDKRGTGLSDRDVGLPDFETRMDDIRTVMDEVSSQRAAIMGVSEGGPMAALFAATYPERTAASVLYGTGASWKRAPDYPWAPTEEQKRREREAIMRRWGEPEYFDEMLDWFAPSRRDDEEIKRWWRRWALSSASPSAAQTLSQMNSDIDIRHVLPTIRAPTLVLRVADDRDWHPEETRYLAERIPDAELVTFPGADHGWCFQTDSVCTEAERFLTGVWDRGGWHAAETRRVLATLLCVEVVDPTGTTAEIRGRRRRELLAEQHARMRRHLTHFRGVEIDTAEGRLLARFDGPARAIRCACAIAESVHGPGISIRVGVHTGECDLVDGALDGVAVQIGERVAASARPGEVLVSQTVKDIVAGSGIAFDARGQVTLTGNLGDWRLYAVA